jgi:hypothetical protein
MSVSRRGCGIHAICPVPAGPDPWSLFRTHRVWLWTGSRHLGLLAARRPVSLVEPSTISCGQGQPDHLDRKSVLSSQDTMINDKPGEVLSIYVIRIACPVCSMEQTFRGTPSEIGVAVEAWNSRHQRLTHGDKSDAPTGTGRQSCTPGRIISRASHPVRQESTATRARNACPRQTSPCTPGCTARLPSRSRR